MTNVKDDLSIERLRDVLHYNKETGLFVWKKYINPRGKLGSQAGYINDGGYLLISIDNKRFRAHRLAWFYVYGEWPEYDIDHKNGIRSDNRIGNLRKSTRSQNLCNKKVSVKSKTGIKGVIWDKCNNAYRAQVELKGRKITRYVHSLSEAAELVKEMRDKLHGEFTNHG